ncbi:CatB-related O-acetyltransferase [Azospirillum sp.]|uniref:CatB-related O-acetyltransferase n=1 Tax=Azospirillum sp. TaxID=34012 RepID=UPI003D75517F
MNGVVRGHVGAHSYGNLEIKTWGENAKVLIGKFCSIGYVEIYLGGNHRVDWISTYPFMAFNDTWKSATDITGHPSTRGNVVIGNDVWIGIGATIMSGVTIGDGAVIASKAVVSRNVEPYHIAAGNPAVDRGLRFPAEDVRKLSEIRWWDWPDPEIEKHTKILCSGDVDALYALHHSRLSALDHGPSTPV